MIIKPYNREREVVCEAENDMERLSLCGLENFWSEEYGLRIEYRPAVTKFGRATIKLRIPKQHWQRFEKTCRSHSVSRARYKSMGLEGSGLGEWKAYEKNVLKPKIRRRRFRSLFFPAAGFCILVVLVALVAWLYGSG